MSSIDAALIEYYTKYPELIINSYDWEIIITCARCGGVIPNKHPCITTEIAIRDVEYGKYAANRSNPPGNVPVLAPGNIGQENPKYRLAQSSTSDKSGAW